MTKQTNQPPVDTVPERIWIDSAGRIYPINPDNADFDTAPVAYVREGTRSPDGWDEAIAVARKVGQSIASGEEYNEFHGLIVQVIEALETARSAAPPTTHPDFYSPDARHCVVCTERSGRAMWHLPPLCDTTQGAADLSAVTPCVKLGNEGCNPGDEWCVAHECPMRLCVAADSRTRPHLPRCSHLEEIRANHWGCKCLCHSAPWCTLCSSYHLPEAVCKTERADTLTPTESAEEVSRSVLCVWCGTVIYKYNGPPPAANESGPCLAAAREHDPRCPKNPLVIQVASLTRQRTVLREALGEMSCTCPNPDGYYPHDAGNPDCNLSIAAATLATPQENQDGR